MVIYKTRSEVRRRNERAGRSVVIPLSGGLLN
jgi:hypothetical protein